MMHKFMIQIQLNEDLLVEHHVNVKCNNIEEGKTILKNMFSQYSIIRLESKELESAEG